MKDAKINWPTATPIPEVVVPEDEPKFEKIYVAPQRIRTFVMKFQPYEEEPNMPVKFLQ